MGNSCPLGFPSAYLSRAEINLSGRLVQLRACEYNWNTDCLDKCWTHGNWLFHRIWYTNWGHGTVWGLLASRPWWLMGGFGSPLNQESSSTLLLLLLFCSSIWQFLYLVLSKLSITRSRSWVLTRLLMRWGKGYSRESRDSRESLGRISLERSKT